MKKVKRRIKRRVMYKFDPENITRYQIVPGFPYFEEITPDYYRIHITKDDCLDIMINKKPSNPDCNVLVLLRNVGLTSETKIIPHASNAFFLEFAKWKKKK